MSQFLNPKIRLYMTLIILLPFLLSGCWDRKDTDELAIVIGLGIDRISGNKPVLLTAQIVNATALEKKSGGGSQEKPFIVKTSRGKTFSEAIHNLNAGSSRRIFFAHNKVVVMGKNFAKSGITDMLDFLERDYQFRRTLFILVADQTAKEVIEAKLDLEILPARGIDKMMANLQRNAYSYPIDRNKFLMRLTSDSKVSFAPLVQLVDKDKDVKDKLEQSANKPPKDSDKNKVMQMQETAIFRKDHLIGVLSATESKGLLWLNNKIKGDSLVIPYPENKNKGEVTVEISNGNTSLTPHISADEIHMDIHCTGKAELREVDNSFYKVKNKKMLDLIELETEKKLKEQLEQTISSAQEKYNADFVEFAHSIHDHNPTEWHRIKRDWEEIFPNISYTVTFDVTMDKIGMTNNSVEESLERE